MNDYEQFLATKLATSPSTGLTTIPELSDALFPFQRDLVTWALKRGRAALFASTGLGKSLMQIEWAKHVAAHTGGRVLILAPLSVAKQTAAEGARFGTVVNRVQDGNAVGGPGIYVTNYDRLHLFDTGMFDGVVLDESSLIKDASSKTLGKLMAAFSETSFRLCATATPSPNDYTELGTHAEFLGVCTGSEMLAEFFCHDGGDTSVWRLKGHARRLFWQWVAAWAALIRKPSDLGYEDGGYDLPPLRIHDHVSVADADTVKASGLLFAAPASTLSERRTARKESMGDRVAKCAATVAAEPRERWVVWCELNAEQEELKRLFGDQCISITGSMTTEEKEAGMDLFLAGGRRILLSKPKICGWGINLQFSARMAFVGVSDSFESFYQAVRRIYRFGQERECHVHVFCSELEGNVLENLKRKGVDAAKMGDELSAETRDVIRENVRGLVRGGNAYDTKKLKMPKWLTTREPDYET